MLSYTNSKGEVLQMTDAEYCFTEAIKEKRGMVNGARHTKGKTKRNGTPRDLNVSTKEYKEKCGQVQKFSMNMPMTVDSFNELPKDLQKEYLERLIGTFQMNKTIIGKMLNVTPASITTIMKIAGVKTNFKAGRVSQKTQDLWNNFFSRDPAFHHLMVVGKKDKEEKKEVVKEVEVKRPIIISSTIQISATGYSDIAEQLLSYADQDFPGDELIIKVIRK